MDDALSDIPVAAGISAGPAVGGRDLANGALAVFKDRVQSVRTKQDSQNRSNSLARPKR